MEPPEDKVSRLVRETGVSELTAKVLCNRGVDSPERAIGYLRDPLRLLNDPFLFSQMERAVEAILRVLKDGGRILIFGDYDADGVTGSALLYLFLKELGAEVDVFIPDRFRHGYGLTLAALRDVDLGPYRLVITVDCGIGSVVEVGSILASSKDVIITDHHTPGVFLPHATAIINPKLENGYPFPHLAGVGVAAKLVEAVALAVGGDELRRDVLKRYMPLVALGTVADVMPLVDENRFFVKFGLKVLDRNTGLRTLMEVAGIGERQVSPHDVSFILAPRINAAGRMSHAEKSFRLLTTSSQEEAECIAKELSRENSRRQREEERVVSEALGLLGDVDSPLVFVWGEGWHPGVIGIAASKLARHLERPVLIASFNGSDFGRGSGRSYGDVDLYRMVEKVSKHLVNFGGHARAVGFTVERGKVEALARTLEEMASGLVVEPEPVRIDAVADVRDLQVSFIRELLQLAPFGEGFPEPLFLFRRMRVRGLREIKGGGAMFELVRNGYGVDAISFDPFPFSSGQIVDVVASVEVSQWKGEKRLRLKVRDAKGAS